MKKKDRPYKVLPYNPKWTEKFKHEKAILNGIFGDRAKKIEHIGSTAVEGLWAKPQIGILVIVEKLEGIDSLIRKLESAGYKYVSSFDKFNERYFVRDDESGERIVSVHVMTKENPQSSSHIYFRDFLRQNKEARERYSKLKQDIYQKGTDREEYSKQKKEMLEELKRQAKEAKLNR